MVESLHIWSWGEIEITLLSEHDIMVMPARSITMIKWLMVTLVAFIERNL